MAVKTDILEALGETALVLPRLINRALSANDRVKYFFTLFQNARQHADAPGTDVPSLREEREASGVEDATLDAVVTASVREGSTLHIPEAARVHAAILQGIAEMLEPLKVAGSGDAARSVVHNALRQRLDNLTALAPSFDDDLISADYIDALTRGRGDERDGLHVLVMDLHRELNQLQRDIATESIEGAAVYAIGDSDRPFIAAFMAGVKETAALKFDHPGLATTATRSGERLVIQNDIGTTEAHVLVVHIDGSILTVTYTDVHKARLRFFQSLLEPIGLEWTATNAGDGPGAYQLAVGRAAARSPDELRRHLRYLGSRLVFLIDWNRARKRLTRFLKKSDAIAVLKWAADQQVGHRAFLQLGDVRLVSTAMERAAAHAPIRFGSRLDEIVGRQSARAFLQDVLRISAEGLRDARSARLIQDQIHAEFLTRIHTSEHTGLALAADHATLVAALAALVRDAFVSAAAESDADNVARLAARAKTWETKADQIVARSRTLLADATTSGAVIRLLSEADDVADGLEEAAFLLTLVSGRGAGQQALDVLRDLAELMTVGAQRYVSCLECARDVHPAGAHGEVEEFLVTIDRVIAFEHQADDRERAAKACTD